MGLTKWVCGIGMGLGVVGFAACGSSSDTNDGGVPEAGSICSVPLTACGAACTDTTTDPTNCGACGTKCDGTKAEVCSMGKCGLTCGGGTTKCGMLCADTMSDAKNCGGCGMACPMGQQCAGGMCATACAAGLTLCAPAGEGGAPICADTKSDILNCGKCGNACPPNNTCQAGACVANLFTLSAVPISGNLMTCSTAQSPSGRKVAIDATNGLYAAFKCAGELYLVTSKTGGLTYAAPRSVGISNLANDDEAAIVWMGGAVHLVSTKGGNLLYTTSIDDGKTWSTPVVFDANIQSNTGLSLTTYKGTLYISARTTALGVVHVWRNGMGAGDAGVMDAGGGFDLATLTLANQSIVFNEVMVEPQSGDVWSVIDNPSVFAAKSTNGGATFGAYTATNVNESFSDWVIKNGTIYGVGNGTNVHVLPLANITGGTTIANLDVTAQTYQRAIAIDPKDNLYIATMATGNAITLARVVNNLLDTKRTLAAAGASPNVTATTDAAFVTFTNNGAVFATVQKY